jgi:hypothetical protein
VRERRGNTDASEIAATVVGSVEDRVRNQLRTIDPIDRDQRARGDPLPPTVRESDQRS